jgi:hypothetical protein
MRLDQATAFAEKQHNKRSIKSWLMREGTISQLDKCKHITLLEVKL